MVGAEEIESLQDEDDAFGPVALSRPQGCQQERQVLGKAAEHLPVDAVLQAHLHRYRFQRRSVVDVDQSVESDENRRRLEMLGVLQLIEDRVHQLRRCQLDDPVIY